MASFQLKANKQIIYRELLKINRKAAKSYIGAIRVLEDEENPDRLSQSAHSLREITNLILRDGDIPQERIVCGSIKDDEKQKHKIEKKFVERPELLPQPAEEETRAIIREWVKIHNYFVAVSHHKKETNDEEYHKYLDSFESILRAFLRPAPETIKGLDDLLNIDNPVPSEINRLIELLKHPIHANYFFSKLSNLRWLKPLYEGGFFNKAPQLITEGDQVIFPGWPATDFLLRISEIMPRDVMNIILNVQEADNFRVQSAFIDCALKMPSNIAREIVPLAKKWIKTPYWNLLPDKIGELSIKLANENEIDAAIETLEVLIDVQKTKTDKEGLTEKAIPLFNIWEYGQILKNVIPVILESKPEETIIILSRKLLKAITIDHPGSDITRDRSYIWRPAIENDTEREVKNLLVTSLRNSLESIGRKNKDIFLKCYSELGKSDFLIFRRLKIHLMRLFPELFKEDIEVNFANPIILEDINQWHENYHLLREQYSGLSIETKNKILNWIDKGPDLKDFESWYKKEIGIGPTEKEKAARKEHWQLRYLTAIEVSLPAERRRKYDKLIAKYGKPKHPDFHYYIETEWVGSKSPLNKEEIEGMTISEIMDFIAKWEPERDFDAASREGLGALLKESIAANYAEFVKISHLFKDIHPIYAFNLFDALRELIKKDVTIDWGPIIDLIKDILIRPVTSEIPRDSDRLYDWQETKRVAADLLRCDLANNKAAPSFKYRNEIFEIITLLLREREPDLDYEKKYAGDNLDSFTCSINTIRGIALHDLFQYALWCSRNLILESDENKMVPEAVDLMERLLIPDYEPTQTLRAVFGENIPALFYLNKKWAKDKLEQIFPEDSENRHLWKAAWEAYITYNKIYNDVYSAMKKQYKAAINKLSSPNISDLAKENLSEHLMIAYLWGMEGIEEGSLLELYYERAELKHRGHAIWFIGRELEYAEQWEEGRDKVIKRIEILIKWRIEEAKKIKGEAKLKSVEELSKYGLCFISDQLDKEWAINTLVEILEITDGKIELETQVIDELINYINAYPLLGLKAINLIVKRDKEGWVIAASKVKLIEILEEAKRHHSFFEMKEINNELVGELTKKGHFNFIEYYVH
jgi:hypothetical protein